MRLNTPGASAAAAGTDPASSFAGLSQASPSTTMGGLPSSAGTAAARPYGDIGQMSPNIMGGAPDYYARAAKAAEKAGAPQPGPFQGVPVLGNIFDLVGAVGNLPIPGQISDLLDPAAIGQFLGTGQTRYGRMEQAWNAAAGTPERAAWDQKVSSGWMDAGRAMTNFYQQHLAEQAAKGLIPQMAVAESMPIQSGADLLTHTLLALGAPARFLQGTVLGYTDPNSGAGRQRLSSMAAASNEALQNNPELIRIRDEYNKGTISGATALGQLQVAGFLLSNPTDPLSSFLGDMLLDPVNVLSLASGGTISAIEKAGAAVGKAIGKTFAEDELRLLTEKMAAQGITAGLDKAGLDAIKVALATPELRPSATAALREAGTTASFWATHGEPITKLMEPIDRVLNRWTLFPNTDAARFSSQAIGAKAAEGVVDAFGAGTYHSVMGAVEDLGGKESRALADEYFGTATQQVIHQVGNESTVNEALASRNLLPVTDLPTVIAGRKAAAYGSDIFRYVRDKVEGIRYRPLPTGAGKAALADMYTRVRARAAQQMQTMFPALTGEQAAARVARMSDSELSMVDYLHYGKVVKDLLQARSTAAVQDPAFHAGEIAFLGPRQLTTALWTDFRKALKSRDLSRVRDFIKQYDDLYFNLRTDVSDEVLTENADAFVAAMLKQKHNWLPTAITKADKLPQALQDFEAKYGPQGYGLVWSPKDKWRPTFDDAGMLRGINPWVDYVDNATVAPRVSQLRVMHDALFHGIAGSSIQRDAMHRLQRQMAETWGIPADRSRAIFHAIQAEAEREGVAPRGLTINQMYDAAMKVKMPADLASSITPRQLAEQVVMAHEGYLSRVGLTQKFTGLVKSQVAGWGQQAGVIAENIFPKVRFKYNPGFQVQELVEAPFYLIARGIYPLSALKDIPGAILGGGIKGGVGGVREAVTRLRSSNSILNDKTLFVRELLMTRNGLNESRYGADMAELDKMMLFGSQAAEDIGGLNSRLARILGRLPSPAVIKRDAEARMFRSQLAALYKEAIRNNAPGAWDNVAAWWTARARYGMVDDGKVAVEWLYDMAARSDPDAVFSRLSPSMFRPAHLGEQARVSTRLVRYLLLGDGYEKTSWPELGRMVRDPKRPEWTAQKVADVLRGHGADEDYIHRTVATLTFPTPDQFFRALERLPGQKPELVQAMRDLLTEQANRRGQGLHEYLAYRYAGAPLTLDQFGNYSGQTHFQVLTDSLAARGKTVLAPTDERVRAVRDTNLLPEYLRAPVDEQGRPIGRAVGQLTSDQRKAREWDIARARRAGDPEVGAPVEAVDQTGQALHFVDASGNVTHTFGHVDNEQWVKQVQANIPEAELRTEYGEWYADMRTAFMALVDNDPVRASHLLTAFGVTQMNTSPVTGMMYVLRALERVRRGESLDDVFLGLGGENLAKVVAEKTTTGRGLGQKLVDFIDSLLGSETRRTGVTGPAGNWQPVAGDIWAMRDLGFIDASGLEHVARGLGATRFFRDDGRNVHFVMPDGSERVLDRRLVVGGSPTNEQYDYIVERYNDIKDHLNATAFDGRTDWTAADVQALGWFRAKRTFGDPTGSPLDALHRHTYSLSLDILPAPEAHQARIFPSIEDGADEASLRAIAADVAPDYIARSEQVTGVRALSHHEQTGSNVHVAADGTTTVTDVPGFVTEVQASSLDEASRYAAALGVFSQQSGVVVTRGLDPVVVNGREVWHINKLQATTQDHMWAHEWDLPEGIDNAEAQRWHAAIKDADPLALQGSTLLRADDGTWVVRATWGDPKWDPKFADVPWWQERVRDQHVPAPASVTLDGTTLTGEWRSAESRFIENDWEAKPLGEDYVARITEGVPDGAQAEQLLRRHRSGAGVVTEDAYQRRLANATGLFRARQAALHPAEWDSWLHGTDEPVLHLSTARGFGRDVVPVPAEHGPARYPLDHPAVIGDRAPGYHAVDVTDQRDSLVVYRTPDGTPVGYARYGWRDVNGAPTVDGMVHVYVEPAYRGQGIATGLYDYVQDVVGVKGLAGVSGRNVTEMGDEFTAKYWPRRIQRLYDQGRAEEGRATQVAWSGGALGGTAESGGAILGGDVIAAREAAAAAAATDPWMYHGTSARFSESITKSGINRGDWVNDIESKAIPREGMYGQNAVLYRARLSAFKGGKKRASGWKSGARVAPADLQVSRDGGRTWEPVAPQVLFQRAPRGTRGATVLDAQTNRANVFLGPQARADTGIHEMAHVYATHDLDPSAQKLVLDAYNDMVLKRQAAGQGPVRGGVVKFDRTASAWTEDVHEFFANQFTEWLRSGKAPTPGLEPVFGDFAKYLGTTGKHMNLSGDVKTLLDDVATRPVRNAYAFNTDEAALFAMMQGVARRADRVARDVIYFKGERSWLERSLNHQYFGLYPLSYMWGKVLPEMVNFLVFRPFGLKSPLVGLNTLNKVYQSMMLQQEYDPALAKFLKDNEPSFRGISMLMPGLPWDMPVNSPIWVRRLAEAEAENHLRELQGKKALPVDLGKIIEDTAGYAFGPARGLGMASEMVSGIPSTAELAAKAAVPGYTLPEKPNTHAVKTAALQYTGEEQPTPNEPQAGGGGLSDILANAFDAANSLLGNNP